MGENIRSNLDGAPPLDTLHLPEQVPTAMDSVTTPSLNIQDNSVHTQLELFELEENIFIPFTPVTQTSDNTLLPTVQPLLPDPPVKRPRKHNTTCFSTTALSATDLIECPDSSAAINLAALEIPYTSYDSTTEIYSLHRTHTRRTANQQTTDSTLDDIDLLPSERFAIDGTLNGIPVHVLAPDSGCNTIAISKTFCDQHNIPTYLLDQQMSINYSNGTTDTTLRRTADLTLQIQGLTSTIRATVVPYINGYDIILGTPFFQKHQAVLDFGKFPRQINFQSPKSTWLFDIFSTTADTTDFFEVVPPKYLSKAIRQAKAANSPVSVIDLRALYTTTTDIYSSDANCVVNQIHSKVKTTTMSTTDTGLSTNAALFTTPKTPPSTTETAETNSGSASTSTSAPPSTSDDFTNLVQQYEYNHELQALLLRYKHIFMDRHAADPAFKRKPPTGGPHKIQLKTGTEPPKFRPYRISYGEALLLHEKIKELLDEGFITPSHSEYGSPALLVPKPNGRGHRLVIDYRQLNANTIPLNYTPPNIAQIFDTLRNADTFSLADMKNGFYAMPLDPESHHKTAFVAMGLDGRPVKYEWRVLPMGLNGSPASFQDMMEQILKPVSALVINYLDDLIIFSGKGQDHVATLEAVFKVLSDQCVQLNVKKCTFLQQSIKMLGFIVSKNTLNTDPEKVQAIVNYPAPRSVKELRRFLGTANFLHHFIKRFSLTIAPLTALLQTAKKQKIFWTTAANQAFVAIKQDIVDAPSLLIPDLKLQFKVIADACGLGIGGSLWQVNPVNDVLCPVAFASQKHNAAALNYSVQEKELLASVFCFKKWRYYLAFAIIPTIVVSDHQSLQTFVDHKDIHTAGNGRRARWAEFLGNFRFTQEYHAGTSPELAPADALSRVFENSNAVPSELLGTNTDAEINEVILDFPENTTDTLEYDIHVLTVARLDPGWLDKLPELYKADSDMQPLIDILNKPVDMLSTREIDSVKRYTLVDDLLYYNDERGPRLCIPKTDKMHYRQLLLHEMHDSLYGGHFGITKTYAALAENFYWPGMYYTVKQYVRKCPACLRNKPDTHAPQGLLSAQPSDDPHPFSSWVIDEITNLPVSRQGNTQILVCTERVIGYTILIPTKANDTAVDNATKFFKHVCCIFGLPRNIYSDRLPKYLSSFWTTLFQLYGTRLKFSPSYHKTFAAQAERKNLVVEIAFRFIMNSTNLDTWEDHCPFIQFLVNNTKSATTMVIPNVAAFGRELNVPAHWLNPQLAKIDVPAVQQFVKNQAQLFQQCKDALRKASDEQLTILNAKRRTTPFKVGDKVLLNSKNVSNIHRGHTASKFLPPFMGRTENEPFTIVAMSGKNTAKLDLPPRMRMHPFFNISMLKHVPDNEHDDIQHPKNKPSDAANHSEIPAIPTAHREDELFTIAEILDARRKGSGVEYLISFEGYPESDNMWLTRSKLTTAAKMAADRLFPNFSPNAIRPQPQSQLQATATDPKQPTLRRSSRRHVRFVDNDGTSANETG